jgi:hypothetical protein
MHVYARASRDADRGDARQIETHFVAPASRIADRLALAGPWRRRSWG